MKYIYIYSTEMFDKKVYEQEYGIWTFGFFWYPNG
jgi:hypothetical protein